jgi:hypothetical protein
VAASAPAERQDDSAHDGGGQGVGVGLPRLGLVAEQEGGGGAERGDLRHGDVHEDDLAGQHVDAQVRVDAGQHEAHQKRRPQDRDQIVDHYCSALASVVMLKSMAAM